MLLHQNWSMNSAQKALQREGLLRQLVTLNQGEGLPQHPEEGSLLLAIGLVFSYTCKYVQQLSTNSGLAAQARRGNCLHLDLSQCPQGREKVQLLGWLEN